MLKDFSRAQLHQLGFSFVMDNFEVMNIYGAEKKKNIEWKPAAEKESLFLQLEQLTHWIKLQKSEPGWVENLKTILHRFNEIRGLLRKLDRADEFLDETELFELKNFAIDMDYLLAEVSRFPFDLGEIRPFSSREIIKILNPEKQITRTFAIYSTYSKRLAAIRLEKTALEKQIALEKENPQPLLQKRRAVFEQERLEENRIKKELSDKMCSFLDVFKNNIRFIAELDFLIAKAGLALKFNCLPPVFEDSETINASGLVNPYVESLLKREGKTFTPVSLCLKAGANVLTGANMGGKTVALSTITLNILLAHCGFFIFGKALSLPVLDYIFFIGHVGQSLSEGLSSFGAEVKEVSSLITAMQNKRGFCALDEFARTTNPDEGRLMVQALLSFAEKYRAFCLLSTHLNGVVSEGMNHFQVVGLKGVKLDSYLMSKSRGSFHFLQELMDFNIESIGWNSPPPQDAIRVAELLGLQKEFLDLVKDLYKEKEC